MAGSGLRLDLDGRLIRFCITLYDLSGLIKCLNNFNDAGQNASKGVVAFRTQSRFFRGFSGDGGKLPVIQIHSRQRAHLTGLPLLHMGVQGG